MEGHVYLPRLKFNTRYALNDPLQRLGIRQAFDPGQADFSGMDGSRSLYLQLVVHQAYVAIDEQGTEAAAGTGAAVGATAAPLQTFTFRADHPFIFIIQQRQSGNILFIGRVENPLV
jgi:serpin B